MQAAPQAALGKSSGRGMHSLKGGAILDLLGKTAGRIPSRTRTAGAPAAKKASSKGASSLAKHGGQGASVVGSFASLLERLAKRTDRGAEAALSARDTKAIPAKRELASVSRRRSSTRKAAADGERKQNAEHAASAVTAQAAAVLAQQAPAKADTARQPLRLLKGAAEARERNARVSGDVTGTEVAAKKPRLVLVDLRAPEAAESRAGQTKSTVRKARMVASESGADKAPVSRGQVTVLTARASERTGEGSPLTQRFSAEKPAASSGAAKASAPAESSFSQVLRDEVVRHASVVVRDGGEGEIRLLLKPDSLGEVRIRMKVVEDSIEGRIVVQSSEARELFQDNLASLEATLREQGFQNARLDVAVSDGGRDRQQAEQSAPAAVRSVAAEELDRSSRVVLLTDAETHTVDLVV